MKDLQFLKEFKGFDKNVLEGFGSPEEFNQELEVFWEHLKNFKGKLESKKNIKDLADYAIVLHLFEEETRKMGFETLADVVLTSKTYAFSNQKQKALEEYINIQKCLNEVMLVVRDYLERNLNVMKKGQKTPLQYLLDEGYINSSFDLLGDFQESKYFEYMVKNFGYLLNTSVKDDDNVLKSLESYIWKRDLKNSVIWAFDGSVQDDYLNLNTRIRKNAYLVTGSLPYLYNTLLGFWIILNGVIPDLNNGVKLGPRVADALKEKRDIVVFSNEDARILQEMYEIANKFNIPVIPVAFCKAKNTCIMEEAVYFKDKNIIKSILKLEYAWQSIAHMPGDDNYLIRKRYKNE